MGDGRPRVISRNSFTNFVLAHTFLLYHPESLLKVAVFHGGGQYYHALLHNLELEFGLLYSVCAGLPVALASITTSSSLSSSAMRNTSVAVRVAPSLALIRMLLKCPGVCAVNEAHLQALWDALVVGSDTDSDDARALRDVAFSLFFDLINIVPNSCVEFLFRRLAAVAPSWFATHTRLWNCVCHAFTSINMGSNAIGHIQLSPAIVPACKRGGFHDGAGNQQRGHTDADAVYFAASPPAKPLSTAAVISFESAHASAVAAATALPLLSWCGLRVCSTNGLLFGRGPGAVFPSLSSALSSSLTSFATRLPSSGGVTVNGADVLWTLALRHADALPRLVLDDLVMLLIGLYTDHSTLAAKNPADAAGASSTSVALDAGAAVTSANALNLVDRLALTHSFLDIVLAGTIELA